MEETAVAVPFTLSSRVSNESAMEITGLKFLADTSSLLSCGNNGYNMRNNHGGISEMINEEEGSWNSTRKDDLQSVLSDSNGISRQDCSALASSSLTNSLLTLDRRQTGDSGEVIKVSSDEPNVNLKAEQISVDVDGDYGNSNGELSSEVQQEKKICRTGSLPSENLSCWGFTSICGKRPEMEDSVAVEPRFLQILTQMLINDSTNSILPSHLKGHFFGVYDGHGGCQVCFQPKSCILFKFLL